MSRHYFPCRDLGPFNPCLAHTKNMSGALLRAQQVGRARMVAFSRALRLPLSRPKTQVATKNWSNSPGQVVTSKPGHDLKQANPCRDTKLMSRHQMPTTPYDAKLHVVSPARSRHQFLVAAPNPAEPCRDTNCGSGHRNALEAANHVAT